MAVFCLLRFKTRTIIALMMFLVMMWFGSTLVGMQNVSSSNLQSSDIGTLLVNPQLHHKRHDSTTSSPLNDKSVPWDDTIPRLWLNRDDTNAESPPALITITSVGWNQANQTEGLTHYRTKRTRELLLGIINHCWFHPTAWDDMLTRRWSPPNGTRIYVFMDTETCGEANYPRYGVGLEVNADTVGNRTSDWRFFHPQNPLREIMATDVMRTSSHDIKLIILNCGGDGVKYRCLNRAQNKSPRISLASLSASPWHHFPVDQGFPPPVVKEVPLNQTHLDDVRLCNENSRPFLMTFAGNFRSQTRKQLRDFVHNGEDVIMASGKTMNRLGMDYETLLRKSKFGAAPRGDNLFSYRFSETMSSGAIPVIYADDWVLPFERIIDWSEISVIIREKDLNQTHSILSRIGNEKRCQMRQKLLEVYEKYVRRASGTIRGIIESLEAKAEQTRLMDQDDLKEYLERETQLMRGPP